MKSKQYQNNPLFVCCIATARMAECVCDNSRLNLVYCLEFWMVWIPACDSGRIQDDQFQCVVGMKVGCCSHVFRKLVTCCKSWHIFPCQYAVARK